jgi:hypothetical protein
LIAVKHRLIEAYCPTFTSISGLDFRFGLAASFSRTGLTAGFALTVVAGEVEVDEEVM